MESNGLSKTGGWEAGTCQHGVSLDKDCFLCVLMVQRSMTPRVVKWRWIDSILVIAIICNVVLAWACWRRAG